MRSARRFRWNRKDRLTDKSVSQQGRRRHQGDRRNSQGTVKGYTEGPREIKEGPKAVRWGPRTVANTRLCVQSNGQGIERRPRLRKIKFRRVRFVSRQKQPCKDRESLITCQTEFINSKEDYQGSP